MRRIAQIHSYAAVLLVVCFAMPHYGVAQEKKKECGKPPKIVSQPRFPKEDQKKAKKLHVEGNVALTIDEDGNVADANVVTVSPKQGADLLLALAKSIKFAPRPGCGSLKSDMHFSPQY